MVDRPAGSARLAVRADHAVVADLDGGHGDDLPRVGRIGQHFLISRHARVEDHFTDRGAQGIAAVLDQEQVVPLRELGHLRHVVRIAERMREAWPYIGHIQVGDVPGRHEPGTGEINYAFLFDFIDKLGYSGWIGCEYKPLTNTDAGVGWVRKYLS